MATFINPLLELTGIQCEIRLSSVQTSTKFAFPLKKPPRWTGSRTNLGVSRHAPADGQRSRRGILDGKQRLITVIIYSKATKFCDPLIGSAALVRKSRCLKSSFRTVFYVDFLPSKPQEILCYRYLNSSLRCSAYKMFASTIGKASSLRSKFCRWRHMQAKKKKNSTTLNFLHLKNLDDQLRIASQICCPQSHVILHQTDPPYIVQGPNSIQYYFMSKSEKYISRSLYLVCFNLRNNPAVEVQDMKRFYKFFHAIFSRTNQRLIPAFETLCPGFGLSLIENGYDMVQALTHISVADWLTIYKMLITSAEYKDSVLRNMIEIS
ncbi:hypothetical protein CAPTEDRAFT_186619 [Capitella teleta]|uniref:DUF262 domain-containing protein n=1 Tax=Capitella teleta TaxID=283909 RepID=R7VKG7_CAPTE|nr:hypothetical protein CAPTEDRAFT_186619 [Capitella teleta]|eukprot:ELU17356.1 hypothetical protein CAPTEDRAFT_186619 [Capitella teleta]